VGAGRFRRALRRDEIQFRREMIEIVVKVSHGEIIGFASGNG